MLGQECQHQSGQDCRLSGNNCIHRQYIEDKIEPVTPVEQTKPRRVLNAIMELEL